MVVIITITHHQQLSVFICSRFGFFRWNTHSAIASLEMLGDGSGSSGSRPTTASLGSSATRTTSSGDQSLGLRSAASGSWGDVCSGPVPRPPEPAPPTAMAPAPQREPTLLPPWHLPRAIPGQPPPPLWPPPQCRETPLCHEPTQGQCICCKNMFARVTSQGRACDALQSPYATCACPGSTSVGKILRWKNRHRGTPRRSLEVTASLTLRPSTRPTRQDCPSQRARCPHPRPPRGRSPLLRKWPSGSSSLTACSSSPVAPAAPLLLQWPSGSSSPTSRQYGVPPR